MEAVRSCHLCFDAETIDEFRHFVGGRSTDDGVCVEERAGGGIDGYTYSCRHDTAADSDVGLEGQEKGRFGEGPTMTGELPK